jgi:phage shock protein E
VPIFIDVREADEFAAGHVVGAVNIPLSQIPSGTKNLEDIPKDAAIVLYCRSGNRSAIALNLLKQLGYTNPVNGINQAQVDKIYL